MFRVEVVPLKTRFPGITIKEPTTDVSVSSLKKASSSKGKQVLEEEEHVYSKNIKAHRPGVPFINLSSSGLAGRFNRASRCLINQDDMDFLDSMSPAERMQKAQSAMAEGLIRMLFETSKIQQNKVDQETIRTLTSRIDEQNEKVAEQIEQMAKITAKLEKCRVLTERLDFAEQWRDRLKDILAETGGKLENTANMATNIAMDVSEVLNTYNKVSAQGKHLVQFIREVLDKMEQFFEAAKYYQLKSERSGRIAKEWLSSDKCGAFMARLSGEMIHNGILLEAESHRLAAEQLGIDAVKLASLAKMKRNEALQNLTSIFNQESATLNDPEWVIGAIIYTYPHQFYAPYMKF